MRMQASFNQQQAGHKFSQVPSISVPRSSFNRTHSLKTTFDAGKLIPILVDEVLPGDTFNLSTDIFARLNTPLFPVMDDIFLETFFFFVPHRLVWENWQKFCGEQVDPGDSIDYSIPQISSAGGGYADNSLFDYMQLPTRVAAVYKHSALPFRAYREVYNQWFRDQNLQDSADVAKDDADANYSTVDDIFNRGKRHDYFTSCLPWLQKGDAVSVPLGVDAPVKGLGVANQVWSTGPFTVYETDESSSTTFANAKDMSVADINRRTYIEEDVDNAGYPGVYTDLTNATAATINQLRESFQVQRLLEKDARAGTRYTEIVRSHFGVKSPDARLQRPEYLGGGSTRINVTPVANTSDTANYKQGELSGVGVGFDTGHGFVQSFTEHGTLIGLVSVRANLHYQQGLNKMWSRETRYDFYWPSLAHIGEQAVLNKEIYLDGSANDEDVFGYQERYAEMRYKESRVTGRYRSSATTPLDAWHLAQDFASLPILGDTFIQENPPMDRIVAVTTEPDVLADFKFHYRCVRPMPLYGVPGMIDHF